jgi:uncharacterized repeat protein (TIGR01451 family)
MHLNFRSFLGIAFLFLLVVAQPVSAQIITNVVPPLGSHGDLVRIFGNGFAPGNHRPSSLTVDFNGALSTSNTNAVVSDSEIDITNVPSAATSGYIHAFLNGNEAISPQQFVVISTNAYVTNFSPIYGAPNTPVTLTGVHFVTGGATNVTFNGVLSKKTATTPVINSDNSMTVTAPDGVLSGSLIVLSKFGAAHNFSTANNVITTATNFFAGPKLVSFSPGSGQPNISVTLKGTNFIAASAVQFGSVNASYFNVADNNTIQATVPTNASTAIITISPPTGTILSPGLSATAFKMLPTIYNFSPGAGAASTLITISGAALNEKSPHPEVTVGGGTVTVFGTISPNTLSFNVPATATSGLITVTTTNGSASGAQVFYLPASITDFTPIGGPAGTVVKISGNNFTNASAVSFNGVPAASFVVTNNSVIGAIAPAGATSGLISITTPYGTTNSTALFYAPPTITSFSPIHGLPGTNVTITGTSFTNALGVLFNGTPAASFTVSNNTTLSARVPNGATTGKITVEAPGGTNSSPTDFTIDLTDLAISVTDGPDPVFVHSNLVYTIVINNNGPVSALNVQLTNQLPVSVTLKSATTSQGSLITNANPVFGALGNINNGSSATVTLTVIPSVPGLITNIASIGSDSLDPNSANNSVTTVTTVWPLPFLAITNLMSNDLVRVSWPAPLSGFTLQFRTDLATGLSWTNDPALKTVTGTNVSVIETNIGTARFFRLTN